MTAQPGTYKRKRRTEARAIMERYCAAAGQRISAFTINKSPRPEAKARVWGTATMKAKEAADTSRSVAFLRGYLEIAGPLFFATGIPLEAGDVLHPDRSVIKRLLGEDFLALDETTGRFSLTAQGDELLRRPE